MPAKPLPKSPTETYDLLLRDVPGDVLIALESLAGAEGRSVMAEARKLLQESVRRRAGRKPA